MLDDGGCLSMKKNIFNEYSIDIEYELNTYKNVGNAYNRKSFWGRYENRNEKKYKVCNKYSDWEKHIKEIIPSKMLNHNDMLHWLYDKKWRAHGLLEAIKCILIPIYAAFLTLLISLAINERLNYEIIIFLIVGIMFLLVVISTLFLKKSLIEVAFYDDFIKIMEKSIENTSHQK